MFTDRRRLQSLLGNLIGKAVKYTARGGILVGIRRRGRQVLIQVWDTGIGIEPKHMNSKPLPWARRAKRRQDRIAYPQVSPAGPHENYRQSALQARTIGIIRGP